MTMYEPRHVESPEGAVQVPHGTGILKIDRRWRLLQPGPASRAEGLKRRSLRWAE